LAESFDPKILKNVIYVADSALVTADNLQRIDKHHLKLISRLFGNFSQEKELKAKAWENEAAFQALGCFSDQKDAASYRVQEFKEELYGKRYRFLVVYSTKLDGRKTKSLQKRFGSSGKRDAKTNLKAGKAIFYLLGIIYGIQL